jgi:hypothetical protein
MRRVVAHILIGKIQGGGLAFSDKQENNRDCFVAVVGLTVQNLVQHQGRIRPLNRAGSLDLYGKVGAGE